MSTSLRSVMKRQHHAALAMLRQCAERCPDEVWLSGVFPRNYWRIYYHGAFYAHLYLYESVDAFVAWPKHDKDCVELEDDPPVSKPYTRDEMLEFVDLIDSLVDSRIDEIDIEAEHCGFRWYPNVTRAELYVLSLRHLHGHIGQMSEILIAQGLDVDWMGQKKTL